MDMVIVDSNKIRSVVLWLQTVIFLQSPGMADQGSHVFVLTFTHDQLIGRCVLLDGSVRDQFRRPRRDLTSSGN